jgi:hypothetical protein
MKLSDKVMTEYGTGTIVGSEGDRDSRVFRWLVKLDNPPKYFIHMQDRQGGLYISPCRLKKEEKSCIAETS